MGLKLLKRLSSRRLSSLSNHSSTSDSPRKARSKKSFGDDVETLSGSSHQGSSLRSQLTTSKGAQVESLAQQGKFKEVVKLFSQSHVDDWFPQGDSEGEEEAPKDKNSWPANTPTPLHVVLEHNPTAATVSSMLTILHERFHVLIPEEFVDDIGRTPLHVAVAAGCTVEVAQVLLDGESHLMPAVLKDSLHRTPLHWACQPAQKHKSKRKRDMALWHQRQVIQVLLEEFPEAASIQDEEKKTPLEYAEEAKLVSSLVADLRREHDKLAPKKQETKVHEKDEYLPPAVPSSGHPDDVSTIGYGAATDVFVEE